MAVFSKSKRRRGKNAKDDPPPFPILHPLSMTGTLKNAAVPGIRYPTSLFPMGTPLESILVRKIIQFQAKKVCGSMLLKSLVFEIWEPKDHRSLHRSQWQALESQNHLFVFPPENARFSRGNAWEFIHDPSTSGKCVFQRRKFFFRNEGISLSIDSYGRRHDILALISRKQVVLRAWTRRPFLLEIE